MAKNAPKMAAGAIHQAGTMGSVLGEPTEETPEWTVLGLELATGKEVAAWSWLETTAPALGAPAGLGACASTAVLVLVLALGGFN